MIREIKGNILPLCLHVRMLVEFQARTRIEFLHFRLSLSSLSFTNERHSLKNVCDG